MIYEQSPSEAFHAMHNKSIENQLCTDCKANRSAHVNTLFGTFICDDCARHFKRIDQLGLSIKSLNGKFNSTEASLIKGNHIINAFYEKSLPDYFNRPDPNNDVKNT